MNRTLLGFFPFVGREMELTALREIYRRRQNLLIVGETGVGKSALIRQLHSHTSLAVVEQTSKIGLICGALEHIFECHLLSLRISDRKRKLLTSIRNRNQPVVFDSAEDTTKSAADFIYQVSHFVPIWVVCRSDLPHEIGRISEHLANFVRLDVPSLKVREVRSLIALCIQAGRVRRDALAHVSEIYSFCRGNPGVLARLLEELNTPAFTNNPSLANCLRRLRSNHRHVPWPDKWL